MFEASFLRFSILIFASKVGLQNQIRVAWKWSFSLLKRDWTLPDYPISIREHAIDPAYVVTRLKQHRYSASIVNWEVISGGGNTKGEALEELQKRFAAEKAARAKEHKRLPRPGAHVPIEFASRQCVRRSSGPNGRFRPACAEPRLGMDFRRIEPMGLSRLRRQWCADCQNQRGLRCGCVRHRIGKAVRDSGTHRCQPTFIVGET